MKDKYIFRKNMLKVTVISLIVAVVEVAFLLYFMFNFIEEERRFAMIILLCAFVPVFPGLLFLLFNQYLAVNDETVTLCKLFKRKQTINWKDATITETTGQINNVVLPLIIISDGTNEIKFYNVGGKDLQTMKDLCKNAREKYNTDNVTF